MIIRQFQLEDYPRIIAFLVALNREKQTHINWNWARFEWMFFHPEFRKDLCSSIRLWIDEEQVVALAVYDMYFGEGACLCLPGYESLQGEVISYALSSLIEEGEFAFALEDNDAGGIALANRRGFHLTDQEETILSISLEFVTPGGLPDGYSFVALDQKENNRELQWVIYQGFDHSSDENAFEEDYLPNPELRPHFDRRLTVGVKNEEGELVSLCGGWFLPGTDYVYIEPVCTIPEYRGRGIGLAAVNKVLEVGRTLGAKKAYVISDNSFYKKAGFAKEFHYFFYRYHEK